MFVAGPVILPGGEVRSRSLVSGSGRVGILGNSRNSTEPNKQTD